MGKHSRGHIFNSKVSIKNPALPLTFHILIYGLHWQGWPKAILTSSRDTLECQFPAFNLILRYQQTKHISIFTYLVFFSRDQHTKLSEYHHIATTARFISRPSTAKLGIAYSCSQCIANIWLPYTNEGTSKCHNKRVNLKIWSCFLKFTLHYSICALHALKISWLGSISKYPIIYFFYLVWNYPGLRVHFILSILSGCLPRPQVDFLGRRWDQRSV